MARPRRLLDGDVPSPIDPPPGCHFHTRCPHAQPRCRQETPRHEIAGPGHTLACHFWREIPPFAAAAAPVAGAAQARLEKLQARFVERAHPV
jgi:hypothetical protein